jgi:hypothetical protein
MKHLIFVLIFLFPAALFSQLYYLPITDDNIGEKHKFIFEDNNEILWTIKLKDNVKVLIKDIPYKHVMYYDFKTERVTPKEYLITESNIFFPNDRSLIVLDRKGKLIVNLMEDRKQLFDSTESGKYSISTPGGNCTGNPGKGWFMEFCGDYLFYVTGKKILCMDPSSFEIIQEFNFIDFPDRGKAPNHKYIFEAVEFKIEIEGSDLVN